MATTVLSHSAEYLDFYRVEPLVKENTFLDERPDRSTPPSLPEVWTRLPQPFWDGHKDEIAAYWRAWEIAFKNLRRVHTGNKFISPFIDTAFNDCLFMWDSCFILMYGKYGARAFNFQRTLDNLYAKQHVDGKRRQHAEAVHEVHGLVHGCAGFISREVTQWSGQDRFHRHDPASTGPNILAWCEWEYYLNFHDRDRLRRVFPVLLAYHRWCARNRTWPDGSYFSCGLACGMDNQPRTLPGDNALVDHAFTAWVDATAQAIISSKLLIRMADELDEAGRPEIADCRREVDLLAQYIDKQMWDGDRKMFCDRRLRPGPSVPEHSPIRTIGAYWTLLADVVSSDRLVPFVAALDDPALFNRPVRVPSLPADQPAYSAKDIGANYVKNMAMLCSRTGTLWENVAPEYHAVGPDAAPGPVPGEPSKPDFCGWSGLGPITILLEYVFGIRPDVPRGEIVWDIRLLERFGVDAYPFGTTGVLSFSCEARRGLDEEPIVAIKSTLPVRVVLRWGRGANAIGGRAPAAEVGRELPRVYERVIEIAADPSAADTTASLPGSRIKTSSGADDVADGPLGPLAAAALWASSPANRGGYTNGGDGATPTDPTAAPRDPA